MAAKQRTTRQPGESSNVRGVSFWEALSGAEHTELNTRDEISVTDGRTIWRSGSLVGKTLSQPIVSTSRHVAYFVGQVIAEKVGIARQQRAVTPIFKPTRKRAPKLLPQSPVACPRCCTDAALGMTGDPDPNCGLCDGWGTVSAQEASAWRRRHG